LYISLLQICFTEQNSKQLETLLAGDEQLQGMDELTINELWQRMEGMEVACRR
jgi:hypothetical protein